jgi:hypothetical protein
LLYSVHVLVSKAHRCTIPDTVRLKALFLPRVASVWLQDARHPKTGLVIIYQSRSLFNAKQLSKQLCLLVLCLLSASCVLHLELIVYKMDLFSLPNSHLRTPNTARISPVCHYEKLSDRLCSTRRIPGCLRLGAFGTSGEYHYIMIQNIGLNSILDCRIRCKQLSPPRYRIMGTEHLKR